MSSFHSLKNTRDFSAVYEHRRSRANRTLVMYVKENPENKEAGINRTGISVSKKVGNSVIRHRIKRVIREVIRTNDAIFSKGLDIVIVARAEASKADYETIKKAIIHLAGLHGLIDQKDSKK